LAALFDAGGATRGGFGPPDTGHRFAVVDGLVDVAEQTCDVAPGGDASADKACPGSDAGAVVVGGGTADVFVGVQAVGVMLVLFQDHVEAFDGKVVHPGRVGWA
jgi:hypothetical protein